MSMKILAQKWSAERCYMLETWSQKNSSVLNLPLAKVSTVLLLADSTFI